MFEDLNHVEKVVYELTLPPCLSGVHVVFHVSILKKYYGDGNLHYLPKIQSYLMRIFLMRRSL